MRSGTHPGRRSKRLGLAPIAAIAVMLVAIPLVALGCGDDEDAAESESAGQPARSVGPDLTVLPLGDGKFSDAPERGSAGGSPPGGAGPPVSAP